jgi:hypothetical protein
MMKRVCILAVSLLLSTGSAMAQQPAETTPALAVAPAASDTAPAATGTPPADATKAAPPADATTAAPAADATAAANPNAPAAEPIVVAGLTRKELDKPFKGSFFLSPLEVEAIQQALAGRVLKEETLGQENTIPAHRVIRLSGVLYRAPTDWIAWINGKKVTRDNLLPEIVDISVKDSSKVSLKWYDVGLNKVIDITLRPHQTYDIPTGILLPGSH